MSTGLVIGAGPGVGAAVARRLVREGFDVGLLAREPARLERLREELTTGAPTVATYPVDAADPAALAAALTDAMADLGPPSCVVFNAVAWPAGDLLQIPPSALLDSLAVNAVGPVVAAQTCAPSMPAGASLLVTGGGIVFAPAAAAAGLSLGKTAGRLVTSLLAETLTPKGIHVATVLVAGQVAPGGRFDPDAIAGELWRLHQQPAGAWEHETTWR